MKSLFRKATFRNDRNEQPKFQKNPGPPLNSTGNLTIPKMKRRYERIGNTAAVQPAVGGARSRSSNMEGNEMDLEPSGGGGGNSLCHEQDQLLIQIHVPEINVKKCLQFPKDQLIWDVKQQCLAALPKELKESFNYGLFCPPENGKAGKFLDEERRLGDYPFNGPMGYLELKYKRRVYKMISLDEKQLKSLHTRANLRRFLDYVSTGHVEKITKMCSKGLDPNFHCHESGETPLTLATGPKLSAKASKVLIALVNGGALLDYRARDGATAMHRAVDHRNIEAMRTLLQLGASPNYRDGRGLTPLYLSIAQAPDPLFAEMLLHDHATVGATDLHGWQEVHQACKTGLIKHLEHLLAYGANMNAQNASGNTPLHVCAVNGQEACARHLLFRGTNREALNYANQTPGQVAVIAGNMDLAELIQNYREEEVVPIRRPPSYNPNRRSAIGWLCRAPSIGCLISPTTESRHTSTLPHSQSTQQLPSIISPVLRSTHTPPKPVQQHPSTFHLRAGRGPNAAPSNLHHPPPPPASPCPSDRSSVPYSSASSSLSEGSSGMMVVVNHRGHHRLMLGSHHDNTDTASIVTVLALGVTDKSALFGDTSDIISDSSGVGTANSDTTIGSGSISMPGSSVVCVETYIPDGNTCQNGGTGRDGHGHISIREGDIIEVTGATDDGYLEGTVKSSAAGQRTTGLFPSSCVQEVRLRYTSNIAEAAAAAAASLLPLAARDHATLTSTLRRASEDGGGSTGSNTTVGTAIGRVYGRRESLGTNSGSGSVVSGKCSNSVQFVDDDGDSVEGGGKKGLVHFATAPRSSSKKSFPSSDPRTVVLHRGRKGFGFILRGAKATSTLMELTPSSGHCPALQYLDDVDPGGVADMAGLRKGDFLLAINRESVSAASHEHVVELIRRSGELVEMTVVSVGSSAQHHSNNSTLPNSKSGIFHTSHDGASCVTLPPLSIARQYATLPRKTAATITAGGNSSANSSCCKSQAPLPPRRDPKTTLSVGRARAKSMVAGLETDRDCPPSPPDHGVPHDSMDGGGGGGGGTCQPPPPPHSCSSSSSHSSSHYHHSSATTTHQPPRTASIRQRPTSGRITSAELEELFQRQRQVENERVAGDVGKGGGGRVYASVADMKRSKSKGTNKIRFANPFRSISTALGDLHRDFHSTPDLAHALAQSTHLPTSITCSASLRNGTTTHHRPPPPQFAPPPPHHRSQEDVYFATGRGGMLPPPTHPPPPPPTTGQMVKVDVGGRVGGGGEGGYDVGGGAAMDGGVSVETIVSSFRPTTTAKLYESPADMKQSHVAYYNRSRSLPSSHATNRVRKAHSMRNPTVTAAISAVANPPPATIQATSFSQQHPQQRGGDSARDGGDGVAHRVMMVAGCNPYAQPMNRYHANGRPSRSHSTVGSANPTTVITSRTNTSTLPRAHTVDVCVGSPPPPPPPSSSNRAQSPTIPDPDYSCSEPEDELSDAEAVVVDLQQQQRLMRPADGMTGGGGGKLRMGANDTSKLNNRLNAVQLQPLENSGNSNASGSSSGSSSSSMPHSFSVDEIQKGRALLKSSKSYPDNLLAKAPAQTQTRKQQQALEDADNSSSGVSSDQEVNGGGGIVSEYAERLNCILTQQHLQHAVVQTKKIYGKGVNRVQVNVQQQQSQRPTSSSPAVSLIKLPPPQESDDTDEPSVCLPPPPPEYTPSPNASATDRAADPRHPNDEEGVVVLAPPPQFSDARQTTRVRIVGAVPKTVTPPAGSVARM